jgi:hypothetical protein
MVNITKFVAPSTNKVKKRQQALLFFRTKNARRQDRRGVLRDDRRTKLSLLQNIQKYF